MEINCPNCSSKFNLPDQLAKPGAKLRCTVCKNIFQLPGAPEAPKPQNPLPSLTPKPKRSFKWLGLTLLILILAACGGAGWWYFLRPSGPPPIQEDVSRKVELLTMRNVRQYNLLNDKTGKIFVIEGKVVNEFPEQKELIELEGAIYDNNRKPIAVKRQLAGSQLSLFQLQVLSEKEMEAFLNNKMEILANNTNVPPGSEVPFMILFYDPPENVSEFGVKIVDVQNSGGAQ